MTKKEIYQKYRKTVNMTFKELFKWSKTECSQKASLDRSSIKRNLKLLKTPFKEWTLKEEIAAKRTIAFISRMKKVPKGEIVCKKYSKRDISLMNWGYNPFKR